MARFCSTCGSQLPDDAKFCNNCGAPCKSPDAPPPAQQQVPPAYQQVSQPDRYYQQDPYAPAPAAPYYGAPQTPPPAQGKSKKGLIIALIAVGVVLIAGVVLLIVLNPFGKKDDGRKDTEPTTATTATEAPTRPSETSAPTEPAPTIAPTIAKGGASMQDVLDRLMGLEMSPDPDVNVDLALLYEYQYADDSDLREELYEEIADFYGEGEDSLWSIVTGVYGTIINWKVEITDVYPCTGDEYSEMIDDLISYGCKVSAIEEIVKADYTISVTGSEYSDEDYYYLAFIKADGKWYYSYYL